MTSNEAKTEKIYREIMNKLLEKVKPDVNSEGLNDGILNDIKYVSIIKY